MKTPAWLPIALLALAPSIGCAASSNDFDGVVSALEQHYSVHAQRVPMMGFVSACAHAASGGGVTGMRIAEFDHLTPGADAAELEHLVSATLGAEWQRFITERDANGEINLIFARPDGAAMRMLIANYDNGELNIVRMELNGERLQRWMRDPKKQGLGISH